MHDPNTTPPQVKREQTTLAAFFKWATIGFLGLVALCFLFGAFLISRFFPLLEISPDQKDFKFFGGTLHIESSNTKDGSMLHIEEGDDDDSSLPTNTVKGEIPPQVLSLRLHAVNGQVIIKASSEPPSYDCKVRTGSTPQAADFIKVAKDTVDFSFNDDIRLRSCKISLPETTALRIELTNGDVQLRLRKNPTTVEMVNGKISFTAEKNSRYEVNTETTNGVVMGRDEFDQTQNKLRKSKTPLEVVQANLRTTNGVIKIQ